MSRNFSALTAGVFFFAGLGAALAAEGEQTLDGTAEAYVVGGTVVPDGMWPDAALLLENGPPLCTGTLIAPTVVLTAGHCLEAQGLCALEVVGASF